MSTTATEQFPEYHIQLTKSGTTVGFNLCDANGNLTPLAISKEPQPRLSIKMSQGGTKHSDYEPPYRSIEQNDWSGGRGLDDFDLDGTRYYDALMANTWREGEIRLGPRPVYSTGYRSAIQNMNYHTKSVTGGVVTKNYPNITFKGLYGSWQYIASRVLPGSDYTTDKAYVEVKKVGTPNGSLTLALYSATGGSPDTPNTLLASGTIAESSVDVFATMLCATVAQAVDDETYYFIVAYGHDDDDADNHYLVSTYDFDDTAAACYSADGSSWSATTSYYLRYRIVDADTPFRAFFFNHQETLYACLDYADGSNPAIYRNGFKGWATSAGAATLTDSTQTWLTNSLIGSIAILVRGQGTNTKDRYRVIIGNTATQITVSPNWAIQPDETTRYAIVATEIQDSWDWDEVTGHGLTGHITDVLAYNNMVYFCRGEGLDIVHMHDEIFETEEGNRGTFILAAPDSNGKNKIWLAHREFPANISKADPVWGEASITVADLDFDFDVAVTNGSMEADSDWTSVGTPTTQARSDTQKKDGDYSRRVVADADNEGITQTITTEADTFYEVSVWVYVVSGAVSLDFGGSEMDYTSTAAAWVRLKGRKLISGTTAAFSVLSRGGAGEFYADEAYIRVLPTNLKDVGYERITGMVRYGEPLRCWVATTGSLYMEDNGEFLSIPLEEFHNAQDERNGSALVVSDVYLYLSFLSGMERYYKSNLDDMGPNRDEGLPTERRGFIADFAAYPGYIFAAYNAGPRGPISGDRYSSILMNNGYGWHECYRAPANECIQSLFIQPINTDAVDRLWFSKGSDILWIPVEHRPDQNADYRYHHTAVVELQRMFNGMHDVDKYYDELSIHAEYATGEHVIAEYRVDNDTSWTEIGTFDTAPVESIAIGSHDVSGKSIRLRLRVEGKAQNSSPTIDAVVLDTIEHVPQKHSYSMTFRFEDNNITLIGKGEHDRNETGLTTLAGWVDSVTPLTMRSMNSMFDNKIVKPITLTLRPLIVDALQQKEVLIGTLTVIEV